MAGCDQHAYDQTMDSHTATDTDVVIGTEGGGASGAAAGPPTAGTAAGVAGSRTADAPGIVHRRVRIAGAAAAGLGSVALGIVAHAASGGVLPSPPILAGLASLAVLAATLVVLGRLPGWALLLLLGAGQQILHWLLEGLAVAPSSTVAGPADHHGADVPVGAGGSGGHSPEVMLLLHTHLAAALLVGWLVLRHRAVGAWLRQRALTRQRGPRAGGAPAAGGSASS